MSSTELRLNTETKAEQWQNEKINESAERNTMKLN